LKSFSFSFDPNFHNVRRIMAVADVVVWKPISILVLDDDLKLLKTLTAALSSPPWDAASFSSSAEALPTLDKRPFSALLIDALPGYEIIVKEFRKRNPRSPIVVLTAGISSDEAIRIQQAGADLVLLKPIGISVLQKNLHDMISVAAQKAGMITVFDVELRDVMETERRLIRATIDADLNIVNELLSDDYIFAAGTLKENKQQRLESLRSRELCYEKIDVLQVEAKQYAELCMVSGTLEIVGKRKAEDISGRYGSLRIYGRRSGAWKAVAGQITKNRVAARE
jgi:DNA-binding response OmpR family regulator